VAAIITPPGMAVQDQNPESRIQNSRSAGWLADRLASRVEKGADRLAGRICPLWIDREAITAYRGARLAELAEADDLKIGGAGSQNYRTISGRRAPRSSDFPAGIDPVTPGKVDHQIAPVRADRDQASRRSSGSSSGPEPANISSPTGNTGDRRWTA
jgi:hypothetical protein